MKIDAINEGLERALQTEQILHLATDGGPWAVIHPEPHALILTLGEVKAGSVEQLLLLRWQEPARYGAWLPMLMRDGQLALACHRPRSHGRVEPVSEADWTSALELMR